MTTKAVSFLRYTHALVRGIPNSFVEKTVREDRSVPIDLAKAKHQKETYIKTLKTCGVQIVAVSPDEDLPDCVFIEDAAVVVGSRVLLTRIGHPNRENEITGVKDCIKNTLGVTDLHEMALYDRNATLDGGDVLFTGHEFFVGQSKRTNVSGMKVLAAVFPEYPVTGIPTSGKLHIKNTATMAGDGVIIGGGDAVSQKIWQNIKSSANFPYTFIDVDTDVPVNVVAVNGHLLHKPEEEIGKAFYQAIQNQVNAELHEVSFTEFYKADGSLSCCSVLLNLGDRHPNLKTETTSH